MTVFYLGIFGSAVLFSFVLTRQVRNLAVTRGWLASPALDRHLHRTPLPRQGGVAILLAFLLSVSLAFLTGWWYPSLDYGFSSKTIACTANLNWGPTVYHPAAWLSGFSARGL